MENQLYGILTICISIIIYSYAYNSSKKLNFQHCILLIMLAGLLLRIFTSMDFYLHEWDERYHALVAKNLIQNPFKPMLYENPILEYDYKNWTKNHIWLHKQPIPLYSMALSMYVFGANEFALRLPSIILSTLSIYATYRIGEKLVSPKAGLLAAFFFSINGLIVEITAGRVATDHSDVFFFSLITLSIYFLFRSIDEKSNFLLFIGGTLVGLAVLTKWLPALIAVFIYLLYGLSKKCSKTKLIKNTILLIFYITVLVLPWQIYIISYYPLEANWEYLYNRKHIFEALGHHQEPFYYHFDRMRIIFGELVYVPLIWLIISTVRNRAKSSNINRLILMSWIFIPYLFFTIVSTKMQGYILFCASPIFIMTSAFFFELKDQQTHYSKLKKLFLILIIILPIRYSIERIKPFSKLERSPQWIANIKQLELAKPTTKKIIFNCKHPIETMFYTDFIGYQTIPPLEKLKEIKAKGYEIYIDNYKPIDLTFQQLDFVHYTQITGS